MEEQRLIFSSILQHRTNWSQFVERFENRTENSIKNYFYSTLRRIKSSVMGNILSKIFISKELDLGKVLADNMIGEVIDKLNVLGKLICELLLKESLINSEQWWFFFQIIFKKTLKKKRLELQLKKWHPKAQGESGGNPMQPKDREQVEAILSILNKINEVFKDSHITNIINYVRQSNPSRQILHKKDDQFELVIPTCSNCNNPN